MEKIRTMIRNQYENLNSDWQKLSPGKQRKWIVCFFAGYLLLTLIVVLNVWYGAEKDTMKNNVAADHIRNPITESEEQLKDSLTKKIKDHERQ
jgi:hypothetical protein